MSSIVRTLSLVTLAIVLVSTTSKAQDSEVPKFEAGVQFTLLTVNQPTPVFNCCLIIPPDYSNSYWNSTTSINDCEQEPSIRPVVLFIFSHK